MSCAANPFILYRTLGDGGVLFNERTWRTHILTPAAAIIYEAIAERSTDGTISIQEATEFLKSELALDTDADEIKQLLAMLQQLRVID